MIIEWYIPTSYKRPTKYIPLSRRGKIIDIRTRQVIIAPVIYHRRKQVS